MYEVFRIPTRIRLLARRGVELAPILQSKFKRNIEPILRWLDGIVEDLPILVIKVLIVRGVMGYGLKSFKLVSQCH